MNGLRMLHCSHTQVVIMYSSLDNQFSKCPKQSEGVFSRENNLAPVFNCTILILPVEFRAVFDVLLGEKWLLCCPTSFRSLSKSLCLTACRCTLAATIEQALHWCRHHSGAASSSSC